ncbi:MAG: DEAD/DEAH box helicase [Pseudomonadota bacterium]
MSFNELGLSPTLLQAVLDTGYTIPTPIQMQAIPAILTGKDVMAAAQTGTGKTAGFTLPLLQLLSGKPPVKSNHTRALILTPTRELAAQIQESIETYGKHEDLRSVVVFGGVKINPQQLALRKGCDILVATPGRLMDLYQQNAVKFQDIEVLVLDEADRMLDMGFIRDIKKILALLPKKRQNLMFSATFSDEIRTLAKTICHHPVEIDVAPRNSTVELISQEYYQVSKEKKVPLLGKLLQGTSEQVLVFSRTKHGANALVKKLAGFDVQALAIHGNKSQAQRTKALADFKDNKVQVLVATDIAARGIDIDLLAMVINFDMPQVPEDYVHRIGRTGRAGATGVAVSLVSEEDTSQLRAIERLIKRKIPRQEFDPSSLPVSKTVVHDDAPRSEGRQSRQPRQSSARQGDRPRSGGNSGNGGGNRRPAANRDEQPRQHAARSSEGSDQQPRAARSHEGSGQPRRDGNQPRRPSGQPRTQGRSDGGNREGFARADDAGNRQQGRGRAAPAGNSSRPGARSGKPEQAKRPVSGNREGASFAPPAKPAAGFWNSLGENLRKGKFFKGK